MWMYIFFSIFAVLAVILIVVPMLVLKRRDAFMYARYTATTGRLRSPTDFDGVSETALTTSDIKEIEDTQKRENLDTRIGDYISFNKEGGAPKVLLNALTMVTQNELLQFNKELLSSIHKAGGNLLQCVQSAIVAKNNKLSYQLDQLVAAELNKPGTLTTLVNAMVHSKGTGKQIGQTDLLNLVNKGIEIDMGVQAYIFANSQGIELSFPLVSKILVSGGNPMEFVSILLKARQNDIVIPVNRLTSLALEGDRLPNMVRLLLQSNAVGLNLSFDEVFDFANYGGDVEAVIHLLVKGLKSGVRTKLSDLLDLYREGYDIGHLEDIVKAQIIIQNGGLKLTLLDLKEHILANGNVVNYANALHIVKNILHVEDAERRLLNHFNLGGNVLRLAQGLEQAKDHGIVIDLTLAETINLTDDLREYIKLAVTPQLYTLDDVKVTTQNGILVALDVSIYALYIMSRHTFVPDINDLFQRVRKETIAVVESYHGHEAVLENQSEIAQKILNRIHGRAYPQLQNTEVDKFTVEEETDFRNNTQKQLNDNSKWFVSDILISEVQVLSDLTLDIKREYADFEYEMRQKFVNLKLKESKVQIQSSLAKALKDNKGASLNTFHKFKIFNGNQIDVDYPEEVDSVEEVKDDHVNHDKPIADDSEYRVK